MRPIAIAYANRSPSFIGLLVLGEAPDTPIAILTGFLPKHMLMDHRSETEGSKAGEMPGRDFLLAVGVPETPAILSRVQ